MKEMTDAELLAAYDHAKKLSRTIEKKMRAFRRTNPDCIALDAFRKRFKGHYARMNKLVENRHARTNKPSPRVESVRGRQEMQSS